MALISLVGLVRAAVLGPAVAAAAYLALAGFEGSRRLVSPNQPERPCRTPASNGWRYEAINYDQATDGVLIGRTGTDCRVGGAGAGDQVVTSDGVPIAGWWIPAGQEIRQDGPTVVLVHGYANDKHGMLEIASLLHDRYNLVLLDLRNAGQSGGRITTQGVTEERDLRAILDWLAATKRPEQIAVFGQSMGGATALNGAVDDSRIDALILDSTHDRLRTAIVSALSSNGLPFGDQALMAIRWAGTCAAERT